MFSNPINTKQITARLEGRVLHLLIAIILLNLASPLILADSFISQLYIYIYCVVLGISMFVASTSRFRFQFGIAAAVVTTILIVRAQIFPENIYLGAFALFLLAVFQGYVIFVLLEFMFQEKEVDKDVLYTSVTIYLLLANTFAVIHALLATLSPTAYVFVNFEPTEVAWPQFLYFSYATITTLGFGDVVPASNIAGILTVAEAVVGVLYIAIMMARLVGMYAGEKAEKD